MSNKRLFSKLFMLFGGFVYFFVLGGVHFVSAQILPIQVDFSFSSPVPSGSTLPFSSASVTPLPSNSALPTSSASVTPVPSNSALPTASVYSTPLASVNSTISPTLRPIPPSLSPIPIPSAVTTTPEPILSVVNDPSDPSGGTGSPLLNEPVPEMAIFPLPEVINTVSEEIQADNQNEGSSFVQTPGEMISPIIPRTVIERIIPAGLYNEDGLHPIDGLVLLIFGIGFIGSGIALLRSDVFMPALSDIEGYIRHPLRRRSVNHI